MSDTEYRKSSGPEGSTAGIITARRPRPMPELSMDRMIHDAFLQENKEDLDRKATDESTVVKEDYMSPVLSSPISGLDREGAYSVQLSTAETLKQHSIPGESEGATTAPDFVSQTRIWSQQLKQEIRGLRQQFSKAPDSEGFTWELDRCTEMVLKLDDWLCSKVARISDDNWENFGGHSTTRLRYKIKLSKICTALSGISIALSMAENPAINPEPTDALFKEVVDEVERNTTILCELTGFERGMI